MTFPGWNKPIDNPTDSRHKRCVLAKKGNQFKLVKYGHKDYEDYTTHKDKKRRETISSDQHYSSTSHGAGASRFIEKSLYDEQYPSKLSLEKLDQIDNSFFK